MLLLKLKSGKGWSGRPADFVICPEKKAGMLVLENAKKWMKQKYGAKNSAFVRLK